VKKVKKLKPASWWAVECKLALAHLRIAREGLRLAKEREHLKKQFIQTSEP
jgi:hypothetical protein